MKRLHGFPPGNSHMTHLDREFFILDAHLISIKIYLDLIGQNNTLDSSVHPHTIGELDRVICDLIELKNRVVILQDKQNEE